MIIITEKAKHHIKEKLAVKGFGPNIGMRLVLKPSTGKFGLKVDKERERDEVIHCDGSKVLLIDEGVSAYFRTLIVDFGGTGAFPRLFIVQR